MGAMLANTARLRQKMDELELDAVVASTLENVMYLTGIYSVALDMFPHTGQSYAILHRENPLQPHFIASGCEVDQMLDAEPSLAGVDAYGVFYREPAVESPLSETEKRLSAVATSPAPGRSAFDALVLLVRRLGLDGTRIAVDEDGVPPGFLDALAEAVPGTAVSPGAGLFRWVRKVKTAEEIQRVAAAAAVAEHGIAAATAIARTGTTERQLVTEFERAVVSEGGRPKFSLVKIGRNAVAGQTRPTDTTLRRGDTLWFDVGLVHQGYWADIARTCVLGEPPAKVEKYYRAMLSGEEHAIATARPGMSGKELFATTVEAVRESGVSHYRRHHVGHGIGVEVYDRVLIRSDNDDVIEEGTVVNIETPYYEFGFGAVHVEDPFVVSRAGNTLLTTSSRELYVID